MKFDLWIYLCVNLSDNNLNSIKFSPKLFAIIHIMIWQSETWRGASNTSPTRTVFLFGFCVTRFRCWLTFPAGAGVLSWPWSSHDFRRPLLKAVYRGDAWKNTHTWQLWHKADTEEIYRCWINTPQQDQWSLTLSALLNKKTAQFPYRKIRALISVTFQRSDQPHHPALSAWSDSFHR